MILDDLDESTRVEDRRGDVGEGTATKAGATDVKPTGGVPVAPSKFAPKTKVTPNEGFVPKKRTGLSADAGINDMDKDFAEGGAVDIDGDGDAHDTDQEQDASRAVRGAFATVDKQTGASINSAIQVVKNALAYGRKKHGLGGEQAPAAQPPAQGTGAMDFAEGGVVEDAPIDDQSGPAVPIEEPGQAGGVGALASGAAPVTEQVQAPRLQTPMSRPLPQQGPPSPSPLEEQGVLPHQLAQKGLKRIMAYLQGADAEPPEHVVAQEQQVDPGGQLDEGQRKLAVVEAADEEGGPEAAFRMVQHYRKKYDTYRGFAAAALAKGGVEDAAKAASQSYSNVLDGNTVTFAPAQGGVTATVNGSDPIPLTIPQFQEWLLGNAGQYDHVMERGAEKSLQALAQSQGQAQAQGDPSKPLALPGVGAPGQYRQVPAGYQSPEPLPSPFSAELVDRSRKMFPYDEHARLDWLERQQQQGEQNKINMAKAQQESRVDAARINAGARVGAAEATAAGGVQREQVKQLGQLNTQQEKTQAYRDVHAAITEAKTANDRAKNANDMARIVASVQNTNLKNEGAAVVQMMKNSIFEAPTPQQKKFMESYLQKLDTANNAATQAPGGQGAPASPQQPQRQAPQPRQAPQGQFRPPAGAGWMQSPSTGMFKDPQGNVYDQNGNPVSR